MSAKPAALLALALLVSGCTLFGGNAANKTSSRPAVTPTPKSSPTPDPFGPPLPPPQPGPLPGQAAAVSGPLPIPLLIQIENTAPSRPQAGLQAASVIFQYLAEGDITRFSAVFHRVPGIVGPVRSARFVTVYLAQRLGAGVMCSGGSGPTLARLTAAHVPTLVNDYDGGRHFFRWAGRAPPHNVYTTQAMMVAADAVSGLPPLADDLARSGDWAGQEPAPAISVAAHRTSFTFTNGAYDLVTEGAPLTDVIFGAVRPVAVAVLHVAQFRVPSVVDVTGSPVMDYNLIGVGTAELYARGTVIHGTWSTTGGTDVIVLHDPAGNQVRMPRGLLWVSLAP